MAHIHGVFDSDTHFKIDGETRTVKNTSEVKTMLVQYDHNSERFTFEIPKEVDGHDMTTCNVVQVHYLNIDANTRASYAGVYGVDDLQISKEDPNVVVGSWLISRNATQHVGELNFIIRFSCVTDGNVDYAWHTAIHSGVRVVAGISNTETIIEEYPDALEQWKNEVLAGAHGALYVNLTPRDGTTDEFTTDINAEEVAAAHEAGRAVYCMLGGKILPLISIDKTVHSSGVLLDINIAFSLHWGGCFESVWMTGGYTAKRMDNYGGVLHQGDAPIVFPALSDNIGKLFYVDSNGELAPVKLNSALKIEDGELKVQHLYMQYGVPKIVPLGEITLVDTVDDVTKYALRVTNGNLTIAEVK